MNIRLGKLSDVKFGICGGNNLFIGLSVTITSGVWGVQSELSAVDPVKVVHADHSDWTEEERDDGCVTLVKHISRLLDDAKVSSIEELNGIPVEATFDGNVLKSWRVLTEVI